MMDRHQAIREAKKRRQRTLPSRTVVDTGPIYENPMWNRFERKVLYQDGRVVTQTVDRFEAHRYMR